MKRFIEVWNHRPLLMLAYSIGEHQQGSSVEVIDFLRFICLEVTNSHINWISCTSARFRFNKELNYKLAASEVFLPNRNAFAFVASLKMFCTSRRVILGTSCWEIFHCIILFTCIYLIGRALHLYRRAQGFESRTSLNFFSGFLFAAA